MARAVTKPDEKEERKKRVQIEEAANGFIVNTYEYEYEYGNKPKICRTADEVTETVKEFLT